MFRLIDTAGIREHASDEIEAIGVGKSYEKANIADVIIYVYDVTTENNVSEIQQWLQQFNKPFILVGNKADEAQNEHSLDELRVVNISAKNNIGIDILKRQLVAISLTGNINTEDVVVTNARHFEALQKLYASLQDIEQGLHHNIPGDLLALDIRQSLHFLGTITGQVTNEEQLDFIFSKFCIGK